MSAPNFTPDQLSFAIAINNLAMDGNTETAAALANLLRKIYPETK